MKNIVNPTLKQQYPQRDYLVRQVVGIDTSEIRAARIGIRGSNDLVWIGRAANHAAKLTECPNDYPTWITADGYAQLADFAKLGGNPKQNRWTQFKWTAMNDTPVYGSTWWWILH